MMKMMMRYYCYPRWMHSRHGHYTQNKHTYITYTKHTTRRHPSIQRLHIDYTDTDHKKKKKKKIKNMLMMTMTMTMIKKKKEEAKDPLKRRMKMSGSAAPLGFEKHFSARR